MKTHNPFLLLIAATAFCVSARGILGRSLSTELQSTLSASETRPAPVPRSECVCPKVRVCLPQCAYCTAGTNASRLPHLHHQETANMMSKYTRLPQEEDVHPNDTHFSFTDIAIPQARQHVPPFTPSSDIINIMPQSHPQTPSLPSPAHGTASPAHDPVPSQKDKDNSFQLALADMQHKYYMNRNRLIWWAFVLVGVAILVWAIVVATGGHCPDPSKEFLETITNHITDILVPKFIPKRAMADATVPITTTMVSTTVPQLTTMVNPTAPTTTASPSLIPTVLPSTTDTSYILPFYVRLWDVCLSGKQMTDVTYTNGNVERWFSIPENQTIELDPEVNGYPYNLTFGPYSPELGLLRVGYKGSPYVVLECGEIWRLKHVMAEGCVVCDTAEWSGPPLDCSVTTKSTLPYRNTTMDCKVLLGKPQITPTATPTFALMTTPAPTSTPTGGAKGLLIDRDLPIVSDLGSYNIRTVITRNPLYVSTSIATGNTPSPTDNHWKLPFDIQLWEFCGPNGEHKASGVYKNGPKEHEFVNLATIDAVTDVNIQVNGLRNLKVGPLNPDTSILQITYEGSPYTFDQCQEFNKQNHVVDTCVYCYLEHLKLTGDPLNSLDCGNAGTKDRIRKMSVYCEAFFAIDDIISTPITVAPSPTAAV